MKKQELNGNFLVNIVVSNFCNRVSRALSRKNILLITCFAFILPFLNGLNRMYAQDPYFSQPYANKLVLNPGFAGDSECPSVAMGYRNHMPETGAYNTYVLSYQAYSDKLNGGYGFVFMNDRQGKGFMNSYSFSATYAYHFRVSRNMFFNAGLEAGLVHKTRNTSGLVYPDMINPFSPGQPTSELVQDKSRNLIDISSGFIASWRNYYLGFAVHHLNQPNQSLSESVDLPLARKFTVHAGTSIPLGSGRNISGLITKGQWMFSPTFIFQQQAQASSLSYGLYISRRELNAGMWLRQNLSFKDYSLTFLVGFSGDTFSFSYSFDFGINVTGIALPFSGSHEVSVGIKFPCVEKRKKIGAVKCPNF